MAKEYYEFIKQTDKGVYEYKFLVCGNKIIKFTNLSRKMPKTILLPRFSDYSELLDIRKHMKKHDIGNALRTVRGSFRVMEDCFSDVDDAIIIMNSEHPYRFDKKAFKQGSNIQLVMPMGFSLKEVKQDITLRDEKGNDDGMMSDRYFLVVRDGFEVKGIRDGLIHFETSSYNPENNFYNTIKPCNRVRIQEGYKVEENIK